MSCGRHSPALYCTPSQVRCVRPDQSGTNNVMHYLTTGEVVMSVNVARQPFFLPVMMLLKVWSPCPFFNVVLPTGESDSNPLWTCRLASKRQIGKSSIIFCREMTRTRECVEFCGGRIVTTLVVCVRNGIVPCRYVSDRIEALLNDFEERYSLHSQLECLEYLGLSRHCAPCFLFPIPVLFLRWSSTCRFSIQNSNPELSGSCHG